MKTGVKAFVMILTVPFVAVGFMWYLACHGYQLGVKLYDQVWE